MAGGGFFSKFKSASKKKAKIGIASTTGCKHAENRLPSQDAYFVKTFTQKIQTSSKRLRCIFRPKVVQCAAVFDGHGEQGGEISKLAVERIDAAISSSLQRGETDLKQLARDAFRDIALDLRSSKFATDSGTTGSVVLMRGRTVVMAHVGDSSISLWSRKQRLNRKRYYARHISVSHRPEVAGERERIEKYGGQIIENFVVKHDKQGGIALTRTLGDRDMLASGCISDPDIIQLKVRKGDVILVASDGLWDDESTSLKKVLGQIQEHWKTPQTVAENLLKQTSREGHPWDDTTIVCLGTR